MKIEKPSSSWDTSMGKNNPSIQGGVPSVLLKWGGGLCDPVIGSGHP